MLSVHSLVYDSVNFGSIKWCQTWHPGICFHGRQHAVPAVEANRQRPAPSPSAHAIQRPSRQGWLTERLLAPLAVESMLKAAGLPEVLSPRSFRVLLVTDLLNQYVPIDDAQPHTTQI